MEQVIIFLRAVQRVAARALSLVAIPCITCRLPHCPSSTGLQ